MEKHLFEVSHIALGAFVEGLHVSSFVYASALLPTEASGLLFGATAIKLIHFTVEAKLCMLKNVEYRKKLKTINYAITILTAFGFSFINFHSNQLEFRSFSEGMPLFIVLSCTFLIMESSLFFIAKIVDTNRKKHKLASELTKSQELKFWVAFLVLSTTVIIFTWLCNYMVNKFP
jgi:uncharacterized membrane protein